MNYTAQCVSSEAPVVNPNAIPLLFDHFDVRFDWHVSDGKFKLWGQDTFDIYNYDTDTEDTVPFLAAFSTTIELPFSITSVGFTGPRHEPNASQWLITEDTIELNLLGSTDMSTSRQDELDELTDNTTALIK